MKIALALLIALAMTGCSSVHLPELPDVPIIEVPVSQPTGDYPWIGKTVTIDGAGNISAHIEDWPEVMQATITLDGDWVTAPTEYPWNKISLGSWSAVCEFALMVRYGDEWMVQWGDRLPDDRNGRRHFPEICKYGTPRHRALNEGDEIWIAATTASRNKGNADGQRSNFARIR